MSLTIRGMKERIIDKQSGITLRRRGIQQREEAISRDLKALRALQETTRRLEMRVWRARNKQSEKAAELRIAEANKATLESALLVFLREDV